MVIIGRMIWLRRNSASQALGFAKSPPRYSPNGQTEQTISANTNAEIAGTDDNDICLTAHMSISSISKDDVSILIDCFFFHYLILVLKKIYSNYAVHTSLVRMVI